MHPQITALYAAVLVFLYIYLGVRVVGARRRMKTGIGTGGHPALEQAVRVHGNFSEYVPLALVVLLLLELLALPAWLLHVYGIALVIGRLLHAYGLSQSSTTSFGRFYGTATTWFLLLAGSAVLIIYPLI